VRSLLIVVACLAVVLAVLHSRANRQRQAVREVHNLNGAAHYEYQRNAATRRGPRWTDDYFCPITQVVLNDTDTADDDLAKLTALPHLRVLLLQNTAITDDALSHFDFWSDAEWIDLRGTKVSEQAADRLRKKLPKCEISTHWMRGCSRCRKRFLTREVDISVCPACETLSGQ